MQNAVIYVHLIRIKLYVDTYNSVIRELLKAETEELLQHPTDKALVEDPAFRRYVELYARVNKMNFGLEVSTRSYVAV